MFDSAWERTHTCVHQAALAKGTIDHLILPDDRRSNVLQQLLLVFVRACIACGRLLRLVLCVRVS